MRDVLVVGAGPAGIAAGIEARRLGLDALVVDKAAFPRDKTCGDGLTTGALRLLEGLGLDARTLPSYAAVTETVLVSPVGREVVVPLPRDGAYAGVVPRVELDAALVDLARARGVDIREHAGLAEGRDHGTSVTVTLNDGSTVEARWIVAADGHYSPVRRLLTDSPLAAPAELGTWHASRQYFSGVDDRRLWVLFEQDFLPGYAWMFPVGERRANLGFGVLRRPGEAPPSGKALAAQWRTLADRPSVRRALGPHARPEGTHRAWPIPASYDRERLARGRALFAGDAANVVDPMTGEGIAQAIETGALAVRAIASCSGASLSGASCSTDVTERVSQRYRDDVDRALGHDLKFAALLQHVLRSPFGARAAIATAALTPWTRRNFARWMFEDYPRALVLTPGRWKRGALTGRGAYSDDAHAGSTPSSTK